MKRNEIIERINVIKVLSKYKIHEINRRGEEVSFCCPFHEDDTPSAFINLKSKFFHCFGCNEKGDIITFISKLENKTYGQILEKLFDGRQSSVDYNKKAESIKNRIDYLKRDKKNKFKFCNIYNFFIDNLELITEVKSPERKYLFKRGISKEILNKQNIKILNNDVLELLKNKFSLEELIESKIFSKKIKEFPSKTHRIIFPFYFDNNVIAIQLRAINNDDRRYLNIGSLILYNINEVKDNNEIILCEGVIDCLTLLEMKKSAIGVIGAMAFKEDWIKYFYDKKVFVLFDNDDTGRKASKKIKELFIEHDMDVEIKRIEKYNDVNEWFIHKKLKR